MPFQSPRELDPPSETDYRTLYDKTRDGRENRAYQHEGRRSRSRQRSRSVGAETHGAMVERDYRKTRDESRYAKESLLYSDRNPVTELEDEADYKPVQDDRGSRSRRDLGERFDTSRVLEPRTPKHNTEIIDLTGDDDDLLPSSHVEASQVWERDHRGRSIKPATYSRDKTNSLRHAEGGAVRSQSVKPVADRSRSPHTSTLAGQERHVAHHKIYDHARDERLAPDRDQSMHRSRKRHLSPQHIADRAQEESPREKRSRHHDSAQPRMKDTRVFSPTQSLWDHTYTQQQSHRARILKHSPQQPNRGLTTESGFPSQRFQGLIDEESDSNDNGMQRKDRHPKKSSKRLNETPSRSNENIQVGHFNTRGLSKPPFTNPLDLHHMAQEKVAKQVRFGTPPRNASHGNANGVNARPHLQSGAASTAQGDGHAGRNGLNIRPSAPDATDNIRSKAHDVAQGEIAQKQNAELRHPPKFDPKLHRELLQKCRVGIANVTKASAVRVTAVPTEAPTSKPLHSSHPSSLLEEFGRPVNGEILGTMNDGDDIRDISKPTLVNNAADGAEGDEHSSHTQSATSRPAGKVLEICAQGLVTHNAAPVVPSRTAGMVHAPTSFESIESRTEPGSSQPPDILADVDARAVMIVQRSEPQVETSRQESKKLARAQAEAARVFEAEKAADEVKQWEAKIRTTAEFEKQQRKNAERSRWLDQLPAHNSDPLTAPAPAHTSIIGSVEERVGANVRDDPRQPKRPLTKAQRELQKTARETEKRNKLLREQQRPLYAPSNAQLTPNTGPMSPAEAADCGVILKKSPGAKDVQDNDQQVSEHETDDGLFVSPHQIKIQQANRRDQSVAGTSMADVAAINSDKRVQQLLDRGKQKRSERSRRAAKTRRANKRTQEHPHENQAGREHALVTHQNTTKLTSVGGSGRPKSLRPEDDEFIVARRREGKPFKEISRLLKTRSGIELSDTTIRHWYRKLNDDGADSQSDMVAPRSKCKPGDAQLIVTLRGEGKTYEEIRRQLKNHSRTNVTEVTVRNWYRRLKDDGYSSQSSHNPRQHTNNGSKIILTPEEQRLIVDGRNAKKQWKHIGDSLKSFSGRQLSQTSLKRHYDKITEAPKAAQRHLEAGKVAEDAIAITSSSSTTGNSEEGPFDTNDGDQTGKECGVGAPLTPFPPWDFDLRKSTQSVSLSTSAVPSKMPPTSLECAEPGVLSPPDTPEYNAAGFRTTGGKSASLVFEAYMKALDEEEEEQEYMHRLRDDSPIGPEDRTYWGYRIMRKTWPVKAPNPPADEDVEEPEENADEHFPGDAEKRAKEYEIPHPDGPFSSLAEANVQAGEETLIERDGLSPCDVVRSECVRDESGMMSYTLYTDYGVTKVWVKRDLMIPTLLDKYSPPKNKTAWLSRSCYEILVRKTVPAAPTALMEDFDELFDESPQQAIDEVECSTSEAIYSLLGQANKAAALLCVSMAIRTVGANPADSPRWCTERGRRVTEAELLTDEGELFESEFQHWNGKTRVEIWVQERKLLGPRNF